MKYCGVATPFRGIRAYTRCAMGMPGSETALEELMCRVLGDCLQDGFLQPNLPTISTVELTHPKPFSRIGVASYKLFRNAISIFLLQRPLSAPTRLPYLDGYGQKDVYLPVHIALPRCHRAPHLTLFVVYVHLLAHIKSWAEFYPSVPDTS